MARSGVITRYEKSNRSDRRGSSTKKGNNLPTPPTIKQLQEIIKSLSEKNPNLNRPTPMPMPRKQPGLYDTQNSSMNQGGPQDLQMEMMRNMMLQQMMRRG